MTPAPGPTAARVASRAAVADLLAAAALWGGMYVVSAGTFDALPPLTLAWLRLAVGVGALAVATCFRLGVGAASPGRVAAAGAIVAVTLVLQFVGTSLTGGAEGALLTTTTPAFVLLFGALLEGQRVRRFAWAGVGLALLGVAVIALRRGEPLPAAAGAVLGPQRAAVGPLDVGFVGDLLLVASAASWALFSSVGRPLVASVGAFRAVLQAGAVAVVLLAPFVPLELAAHPPAVPSPVTLAAVAYLGVGATAVAWSLWYRGYAAAPATVSAAAFFAQPLVGAALGVALLGERLDGPFLAGAGLVAVGVLAIARPERAALRAS